MANHTGTILQCVLVETAEPSTTLQVLDNVNQIAIRILLIITLRGVLTNLRMDTIDGLDKAMLISPPDQRVRRMRPKPVIEHLYYHQCILMQRLLVRHPAMGFSQVKGRMVNIAFRLGVGRQIPPHRAKDAGVSRVTNHPHQIPTQAMM